MSYSALAICRSTETGAVELTSMVSCCHARSHAMIHKSVVFAHFQSQLFGQFKSPWALLILLKWILMLVFLQVHFVTRLACYSWCRWSSSLDSFDVSSPLCLSRSGRDFDTPPWSPFNLWGELPTHHSTVRLLTMFLISQSGHWGSIEVRCFLTEIRSHWSLLGLIRFSFTHESNSVAH